MKPSQFNVSQTLSPRRLLTQGFVTQTFRSPFTAISIASCATAVQLSAGTRRRQDPPLVVSSSEDTIWKLHKKQFWFTFMLRKELMKLSTTAKVSIFFERLEHWLKQVQCIGQQYEMFEKFWYFIWCDLIFTFFVLLSSRRLARSGAAFRQRQARTRTFRFTRLAVRLARS